jgi:hypothetical protein
MSNKTLRAGRRWRAWGRNLSSIGGLVGTRPSIDKLSYWLPLF